MMPSAHLSETVVVGHHEELDSCVLVNAYLPFGFIP